MGNYQACITMLFVATSNPCGPFIIIKISMITKIPVICYPPHFQVLTFSSNLSASVTADQNATRILCLAKYSAHFSLCAWVNRSALLIKTIFSLSLLTSFTYFSCRKRFKEHGALNSFFADWRA